MKVDPAIGTPLVRSAHGTCVVVRVSDATDLSAEHYGVSHVLGLVRCNGVNVQNNKVCYEIKNVLIQIMK